jgi:hypothetical protein
VKNILDIFSEGVQTTDDPRSSAAVLADIKAAIGEPPQYTYHLLAVPCGCGGMGVFDEDACRGGAVHVAPCNACGKLVRKP